MQRIIGLPERRDISRINRPAERLIGRSKIKFNNCAANWNSLKIRRKN
jgi:hypothetical protein